jgi:long-chain acyl-CoA synthetase
MKGVIDCTIEATNDELLGEAIKAIVVVNDVEKKITSDDLKQYCGTKLTGYKVPMYFEFKELMEVSSTGKKVKHPLAN